MKTVCLHAKDQIEAFLRRHTFLRLYSIGDLDDFFWHGCVAKTIENKKIL